MMGKDMWAKVVQRGVLVREREGTPEALLLRNPNGTWELPGGKIEHGDTAMESLEREVQEETGLVVTDAEPIETAVRRIKKKNNRGKFAVVYRCEFAGAAGDATPVEISDEHVDFAWCDRDRVAETNLKEVDEYRSLRRLLAESPGDRRDDEGRNQYESGIEPATNGDGTR
jgi:8-oxo-dGTP diphosphatase